jgi:hypothetical protein
VFETLLVIEVNEHLVPNPKMALSVPKPTAANAPQAVPTPVVSVATTPVLETKLVIAV